MALLHMDSFDIYGTNQALMLNGIYADLNDIGIANGNPRNGPYSLECSVGNAQLRKVFPSSQNSVGVAYALYMAGLPSNNTGMTLFMLCDATNSIQVSLHVLSTGALEVRSGGSGSSGVDGTLLGTTALPVLTADAYHHIEMFVVNDSSNGTVEISVDDVSVLSLTTKNTNPTGAGTYDQVRMFYTTTGANLPMYVDDFYIYNASGSNNNSYPIGDNACVALSPNGDTADASWSLSTGTSGFALVDGVPPDDTEYLFTSTTSAISRFDFASINPDLTAIKGVMVQSRQQKSDAGSCTTQVSMKSVAALANGATRQITQVFTYWPDIFEVNPNTSAAWTPLDLDAASVQIERIA